MMQVPSHADAFEALVLQAADEGRGEVLFGPSLERARKEARPFMVGPDFPSVYLEFPLAGRPFLDVTALYGHLAPHTEIASPAAAGTAAMLDWFARTCTSYDNVSCGFELDLADGELTAAAVHFQPREHHELVAPFCETIGEPKRATLYLEQMRRMPKGWPLSFFGLFRGRPSSPLRVCGYLDRTERCACGGDASRIGRAFESIGFSAFDDAMLAQVSELMQIAPGSVDFQFDVADDGGVGDTFAVDLQFDTEQPSAVRTSFSCGAAARVLKTLETWGAADERWNLVADAAFARAVNVRLDDGGTGRYALTLMPGWVKARWRAGTLQVSKLYLAARTDLTRH